MRGLPSVGHGVLATVYLALNIAFIFVNVDSSILSLHYIVGARTGWYKTLIYHHKVAHH